MEFDIPVMLEAELHASFNSLVWINPPPHLHVVGPCWDACLFGLKVAPLEGRVPTQGSG